MCSAVCTRRVIPIVSCAVGMRKLYTQPGRKISNPARIFAPESAVSLALRDPPCRFRHNAGAKRLTAPARGGRISAMSLLFSNTAANRSSTTTPIRKSCRASLSKRIAGVASTQSPSDRRRMIATRLPEPRRSRVSVCTGTRSGAMRRYSALFYSSMLASSISSTGISSRIGYSR